MSPAQRQSAFERLAREALARFGLPPDCEIVFVRYGENLTYRLRDPKSGRRCALRIHRPGYQDQQTLRSELAFTQALRSRGLRSPEALPGTDGDPLQPVWLREEDLGHWCLLFPWIEGESLDRAATPAVFSLLGELLARLHEQARRYSPGPGFRRQRWDQAALAGDQPLWGDPCKDPGWSARELDLLERGRRGIRETLATYETTPESFGLIHADLNPSNVLVVEGEPWILDFDDCGHGWLGYDFASALWLHEESADYDARRDAMLEGYRRRSAWPRHLIERLPTWLLARRLAWLGWVESRRETPHAAANREPRKRAALRALERYLALPAIERS